MRKTMKLLPCLAAALAAGAIAVPTASAATTIGSSCTGNRAETKFDTLVQLAQASSSEPVAAPAAGVITKWGVNVIPYEGGISESLKVMRPAGPNTFTVVGESETKAIVGGSNSFDTRLPIQAGDQIAASGATSITGAIFCAVEGGGNPGDVMGIAEGTHALNSTVAFKPEPKNQVALSATIEPDVDKDGYGDETQDKCPQSAASHDPCPVLVLDAVPQPPGKSAVKILVASSTPASIIVSASAKLPGGTKKARVSGKANLAPINQLVTPGTIATYTLNFTKPLKDALKALPKSKSLKLSVTATGKGLDNSSSSDALTVKLKGQAASK